MIKLSIIIPVYGVENYIKQCFESLVDQLTEEVELIFIDDGTKDASIDILTAILKSKKIEKSNNIKIISQKNSGQSAARNNGILVSKGEYVGFIDPDDYVETDYISTIINELSENKIDILHFDSKILKENQEICNMRFVHNDILLSLDGNKIEEIFRRGKWFSFLRVVRKDILKKNFYPEGIIYEDIIAFSNLYKEGVIIREIKKSIYFYRIRVGSSAHTFSENALISADYGLNLFINKDDNISFILLTQFLRIRIYNMIIGGEGLKGLCFWYFYKLRPKFKKDVLLNIDFYFMFVLFKLLIILKFKNIFHFS